jgi:hypothetical protein
VEERIRELKRGREDRLYRTVVQRGKEMENIGKKI